MAHEAATARDAQFILVSLLPDVCLTPSKSGYPVPYAITHKMDQSEQCSPNVFFRGQPAFLHNESYVDNVRGDEAGAGKSLISGTHVKISHSIDKSPSVHVNGRPIVRTGDLMWMNWAKPGAAGASTPKSALASKAARWRCRQQQIAAAKDKSSAMPAGTERAQLEQATSRFERNNVAVEHARLADSAYRPGEAPPGWNSISNDPQKLAQYGLEPDDLRVKGSNFGAEVYEPDPAVFGNDMKPVLAFKGTQGGEDWKNNLAQGLNASTVERYGGALNIPERENITAFRVLGEVLTGVQEQGLGGTLLSAAIGGALTGGPAGALVGGLGKMALAAAMPDAIGLPLELPGHGNPLARHGMDQVIEGIEDQKTQDQATLAQATGKECR